MRGHSLTHQWSSFDTKIATFCFRLRYVMDHSILYRPASCKMLSVRSSIAHPYVRCASDQPGSPYDRHPRVQQSVGPNKAPPSVHRIARASIVWFRPSMHAREVNDIIHPIRPFTRLSINGPVQSNHQVRFAVKRGNTGKERGRQERKKNNKTKKNNNNTNFAGVSYATLLPHTHTKKASCR